MKSSGRGTTWVNAIKSTFNLDHADINQFIGLGVGAVSVAGVKFANSWLVWETLE